MKLTSGEWVVVKEKLRKLPNIHVVTEKQSDYGKITYLASIHETLERGEDISNANIMAASKDMYEAITIGLTGKDLSGKTVSQEDAMKKLIAAKRKAEGK